MTNCEMCHKPVGDGQDHTKIGNHKKCSEEWRRRHDSGKCVTCGTNNRLEPISVCSDCKNNNSDYSGYEGLYHD